ncbi:hypothetical protein FRC02_004620 [Tulasnella sp. 418]|nr:hypothetical protein FRC02_004620 [Tulasnella sp. 418]
MQSSATASPQPPAMIHPAPSPQSSAHHPSPAYAHHHPPRAAPSPSLSAHSQGAISHGAPPTNTLSDASPTSTHAHYQSHLTNGYPATEHRNHRSASISSGHTQQPGTPPMQPVTLPPPINTTAIHMALHHPTQHQQLQQQAAQQQQHHQGSHPGDSHHSNHYQNGSGSGPSVSSSHHPGQAYRSSSDPSYTAPHNPYAQPQQSMPPPTSLPPFSALDLHKHRSGGSRPPPPPLHSGQQQSPYQTHQQASYHSRPPGHVSPRKGPFQAVSPAAHYAQPPPPPSHPGTHFSSPLDQSSSQYHDQIPLKHGREKVPSSNVTSADSSDDEGQVELPTHGMVAPFEAIHGLTNLAERVVEENGGESEPPTRSGSPSRQGHFFVEDASATGGVETREDGVRHMDGRSYGRKMSRHGGPGGSGDHYDSSRPMKRRKTHHRDLANEEAPEGLARAFPDIVTKKLISEEEAKELFNIFFTGCSMFLPVFDPETDSFEALHKRSPFCVNAICMVAAKVRDGGGPPSHTYKTCLDEVRSITGATLFSPVVRQEVVQAMVIIAGWGAGPKDSGWLTCGHATRMALEIGMQRAWPRLLKRMHAGKVSRSQEERELVISARTWFCLYLFEHQMSFGTGRPAVLKEDESVHECRLLLTHPLSIPDDMRLVSMVELMIIRERTHNLVNPTDVAPVTSETFAVLRQSMGSFQSWLKIWSQNFSDRYEEAAFHRQSLQVQRDFAELFHNATALRTIRGPEDVARMPPEQRQLAMRSIEVARSGLDVCLRSPSYREGMKYAVQYTHISATFAASFLIRLARLFPDDCNLESIMSDVEELTEVLSTIPATRFARTLRFMLRSAKRRRGIPSRSQSDRSTTAPSSSHPNPGTHYGSGGPTITQSAGYSSTSPIEQNGARMVNGDSAMDPTMFAAHGAQDGSSFVGNGAGMMPETFDQIARDLDLLPGQEVPIWLSEANLGDMALGQQGLEAFLMPPSMDEQRTVPEIW